AIFPILNEGGKVVAFGARALDGSEPKYLNSPETAVYQKGRTLYGLSWAKDAVRREGRIVLMEGYLDVARAIESGVAEAAAARGRRARSGNPAGQGRVSQRAAAGAPPDRERRGAGGLAAADRGLGRPRRAGGGAGAAPGDRGQARIRQRGGERGPRDARPGA